MPQDFEPQQELVPYWYGTADHEVLNAYLGPWWGGCVTWAASAALIGIVGAKAIGVGTESFTLSKHWVEALAVAGAAGLTWPVLSFFVWAGHYDSEHYTHTTYHSHLEVAIPKAAWNGMAWVINSLAQLRKGPDGTTLN